MLLLTGIADMLRRNGQLSDISTQRWQIQQDARARHVVTYRKYAEGDHPVNLSANMRRMLRLPADDTYTEFAANYMDIVVQSMVDRLTVAAIDSDSDESRAWTAVVMAENRFDEMQSDLHESTIADGDGFLMVYFDNDTGLPMFSHEPAFDGQNGMMVLYDTPQARVPRVAIKVWGVDDVDDQAQVVDEYRVNVYYPDRVERYISDDGNLMPFDDGVQPPVAPWVARDGSPLGVPVIHFRNRGRRHQPYGLSEIASVIPLQNILNRTLVSMTMAAELSAFQIRYAMGFKAPAELTPGMFIEIPTAGLEPGEKIDIGVLPQGELVPYLDMARYLSSEVGRISRTPSPEFGGSDSASGEALKQREIGLLGKVRRFQTRAGGSWEQAMLMAHRIQAAFSDAPPPVTRFTTRWMDAQIRNDKETVENALKVRDQIGQHEFLRWIAPVRGWDEAKIDDIMMETTQASGALLANAFRGFPAMTVG